MRLIVVLYAFVIALVMDCVGNIRTAGSERKGILKAALLVLGCAALSAAIARFSKPDALFWIVDLSALAVATGLGILFDRLRHRRRVLDRANAYGGVTFEEEFRLPRGERIRNTRYLDASGAEKRVDRWEHHRGKYWIEEKTYYTEPGFCRCEWFDPDGRLVITEESEILKYRTFNREYPSGREAAGFLLDRWARSPLAGMISVEEKE
jgi:hypothetical protein